MKICYVALLNFANELVYDALKEHGLIISPYIQQEVVSFVEGIVTANLYAYLIAKKTISKLVPENIALGFCSGWDFAHHTFLKHSGLAATMFLKWNIT